ncbi:MAG: peptide ABC transporter substrate-binding protein [Anaerolineales bacterium]
MSTQTRTLFFLTITVILALVLSACQAAAPTQQAQEGIVVVIPEDPPSFNPAITDAGYDSLVMELVMLGLADVDPNGKPFPELASELPSTDNGDVVMDEANGTMDVTWKLRTDVKWSDGTPVTADDVVFTYKAITDPTNGTWVPGIDYVDDVEKVDDHTVIVHYNAIYPGYLTQFGGETLVIWPAHYCDASQGFSAWDCARTPLSDGPYVLKEWINGDHMTFERNPDFYEQGKPEIAKITVQIVPDQAVRKTMLLNGDADLDMWSNEPMINDLKDKPNVKVSMSPNSRWVFRLFFNLAAKGTTDPEATPHPILSNVEVRHAIRMAIDVDTISKNFFYGYAKPAWTEFFREPYMCTNIPRPVFDPEAAKAKLEAAGWTDTNGDGVRECHGCGTAEDGTKMEMDFVTYGEYGEALDNTQQYIAEELGNIGIKMNISVMEGSVMWAASTDGGTEQNGNFDIDIYDDGYAGIDPSDFLYGYYHSASAEPDYGTNYGRWKNAEFEFPAGSNVYAR